MRKLLPMLLAIPMWLAACGNYNDDPLRTWVGDLEDRIEALEERCDELNDEIVALRTIVNSIERGTLIESVTPFVEEERSGYRITFTDGTTITIYNGTNGSDGDKGDKGDDGSTPVIGVEEDGGVYYWTIDGEWLTDSDGNRIAAQGPAGEPGAAGTTPQLKIEEGYWWVSTDGGQSWEQLGKATGEGGDSLFQSVTQDETSVTFTLSDGTTITVPKAARLSIELAQTSCALTADTPVEVPYTVTGADGEVQIEVLSSAVVKAKAVASGPTEGVISLFTSDPEAIDEYTKVLVFAADNSRTAMAALTFEQGVITVAESCEVSAEEQQLTIPVETNLDYTVTIESGAETWLSRVETRALRVDHLFFHVTENLGATRSAVITLTSGSLTRTVVVAQLAGGEGGEPTPEVPPTTGTVELDRLYGYATGTTGGEAATPEHIHHFDDGHKFGEWLRLREKNKEMTPAIVYLSGTFHSDEGRGSGSPWFDIKRTGNLSIYGTEGFVMENVGFFLNEAENVIIRNIYIKMPKADNGADGISMQESHHIWVDHCTFESMNQTKDYEDGSCDITHASHDVTVSWCHFIKTQKSCLVGHSNSATGDAAITATFHHNYFDASSSRHPRVRYGRVHVYNNFFREVSTYGVGSAYGAMVLVEDNLFDGVRLPTDICTFPAKQEGSNWVSNLEGSLAGFLYARANVFENRPANATEPYPLTNVEYKAYDGERLATPYTYNDFKPAYDYIVDPADQLATIVPAGAGAGKLADYASAPVEVDNGGITTEPDPGTDPGTDPEEPQGGIDLGNGWTALSCGDAAATASTEGGLLTLTARGKFESGGQNFGYVYREVTGDFTATVTVESYETGGTSNQSLAGLLLTPDRSATGTAFLHVMAAQGPEMSFYRSVRTAVENASRGTLTAPAESVEGAKPVLRIERMGDSCSLSYSLDGGATFGKVRTESFDGGLPETLCLGVAVSSGSNSDSATAVFGNVTINGETVAF